MACPDSVYDDCDLLATGKAQACISSVKDAAKMVFDQINTCVAGACDTYAKIMFLLTNAPDAKSFGYPGACPSYGVIDPSDGVGELGGICGEGAFSLIDLREDLDMLALRVGRCGTETSALDQLLAAIKQEIHDRGGLLKDHRECFLEEAEAESNEIDYISQDSAAQYKWIAENPMTSCDPQVLKDRCDLCTNSGFEGGGAISSSPSVTLSGAVTWSTGAEWLADIGETFARAAAASRDRAEGDRMSGIADRLARTAGEDVLVVRYPIHGNLGGSAVALRAAGSARAWPQVVILDAYVAEQKPVITATDRALLARGLETFRQTLGR